MTPTSLKEISARIVKIHSIPYGPKILPRTLIDYLNSANCCVNPNCKGKNLIKFNNIFKKKIYQALQLSCLTEISVIMKMIQQKVFFCFFSPHFESFFFL